MYSTPITKSEIIQRIVAERDMYLRNAQSCKEAGDPDGERRYQERARDIDTLMNVLEIAPHS